MSLAQDCIVPSAVEFVDPRLAVTGMVIEAIALVQNNLTIPGIRASWSISTNFHLLGVQIEYQVADLSQGPIVTAMQPIGNLKWITTDGIMPGKQYRARFRAVGQRETVGPWSPDVLFHATTIFAVNGLAGADGILDADDIRGLLDIKIPSKNLWKRSRWIVTGGAHVVDPIGIGDSIWGIRFPTSVASGAYVNYVGAGIGDPYSFSAVAMPYTNGAVLRGRWVDSDGSAFTDVPEYSWTLPAAGVASRITWEALRSNDPRFVDGRFILYRHASDVGGIDVADLQMEYATMASTGWRPSPDDTDLLRYAGYLGSLSATQNNIYEQATVPPGTSYATGDIWINTSVPFQRTTYWWAGAGWLPYSSLNGHFGSNLYRSSSGTVATLNDFLTSSGIAASINNQSPWATFNSWNPNTAILQVQFLNSSGQLTRWDKLPGLNDVAGNGQYFTNFPYTSDQNNIYIQSVTVLGAGYSRALPAATISSLSPGVTYGIIFIWDFNFYGTCGLHLLSSELAAPGKLFCGAMQTKTAGNVYTVDEPYLPEGFLGHGVEAGFYASF